MVAVRRVIPELLNKPVIALHVDRVRTDEGLIALLVNEPVGVCSVVLVNCLRAQTVIDAEQAQAGASTAGMAVVGDCP